jgi:hypothetical protein
MFLCYALFFILCGEFTPNKIASGSAHRPRWSNNHAITKCCSLCPRIMYISRSADFHFTHWYDDGIFKREYQGGSDIPDELNPRTRKKCDRPSRRVPAIRDGDPFVPRTRRCRWSAIRAAQERGSCVTSERQII